MKVCRDGMMQHPAVQKAPTTVPYGGVEAVERALREGIARTVDYYRCVGSD